MVESVRTRPPETLEIDDDLLLRQVSPLDHRGHYERVAANRDFLDRSRHFAKHYTPDQAERDCIAWYNAMNDGTGLHYWPVYQGAMAGYVGVIKMLDSAISTSREWHMEYWLNESLQGKGIMTRAARKLAEYVLGQEDGFVRLNIAKDNRPSQVVAGRIGAMQMPSRKGILTYDEWVLNS